MCEMNANKIIDDLGGTYAVARLCEIKPGSVSEWRIRGIPNARLMYLRVIRPDVFGIVAKARKAGSHKAEMVSK